MKGVSRLRSVVGRAVLGVFVLAASAGVVGCATNTAGAGSAGGKSGVGRPAPEIVVERLDGKSLSLSSLRGKVVLLDVWASWCGPCKEELPMLDAIAMRMRGQGVEVLAVSVDQERENVLKFVSSRSHWSLTLAHDPRGAIADTLQPDKMPTSYVIDRAGIIRHVNSGFERADAPIIARRLSELAGGENGDSRDDHDHHDADRGDKTVRGKARRGGH